MKKVAILSLSWDRYPFSRLLKVQRETWDKFEWPGVETFFYLNGVQKSEFDFTENVLRIRCEDDYWRLPWLLKRAIDFIWNREWDFIFRTNASSYVCKRRLFEKVQSLPSSGVYSGVLAIAPPGFSFAVGEGVLISRDVANILRHNTPDEPSKEIEDQRIGRIVYESGIQPIPETGRWDFYHRPMPPSDTFHYRCKHDQEWEKTDPDRENDRHAMEYLFEMKKPIYGNNA